MKSGVYKITNLANKKIYIGYAQNLYKRKYYHFLTLEENSHSNCYLQEEYLKYGKENFKFEIIEFCSKELLARQEQFRFGS